MEFAVLYFNLVFIHVGYWFTLNSHSILSTEIILSVLEGYLRREIDQLPITLSYTPNEYYPEHHLGFVRPDRDKNAESFIKHFVRSEESMTLIQKIEFVRSFLNSARHEDNRRLSHQEKLIRRDFIRRSIIFHELGHCDLYLEHENAHSIMNEENIMERIIRERYPNNMNSDDLDVFFNNLIDSLFLRRDTLYYDNNDDNSLWTRILRLFGFYPSNPQPPTEAEKVFELLEALNEIETFANTSALLD